MDQGREQRIIKDFGKNLTKLRKEKKLSSRKLAFKAELDYSNVNEIENGKVSPTLPTIIALAEALEVRPADLMPS